MDTNHASRMGISLWTVFAVVTIIYVSSLFYRMAPSVLALDIASDLHLGSSELSLIGSSAILGFGLMQLPSGMLSDRLGGKTTLLLLTLLAGISTAWFSMAESAASVAASRFLTGLGVSATIPCISILARSVPPELFARISCLMYGCGALGTLAAASPLALASSVFGWRGSMLACGMLSLTLAALLLFFVKENSRPAMQKTARNPFSGVFRVLSSRSFWLLCIVYSGTLITFFGFYGLWFGPYMVEACGLSKLEAGSVLSAGAIAGIAGMPAAAILSDWLHSRKKAIIPMVLLSASCAGILAFFPGKLPMAALMLIAAVLSFCNGLTGVALTSGKELFPLAIMGTATGCLNTLPSLLGAASQKIFGVILEAGRQAGAEIPAAYGRAMLFTPLSCFAPPQLLFL